MVLFDPTTVLIVLAAVGVGAVVLIAVVQRMGWGPAVGSAWEDVRGCAIEATQLVRTRPRVLWPAAILMGLAAASWPLGWALAWRAMGMSYWQVVAQRLSRTRSDTFERVIYVLVHELPVQPGTVASHFWMRGSVSGVLPMALGLIALAVLAMTVRRWLPDAVRRGAGPSARLLVWLLVPSLVISGLSWYVHFGLNLWAPLRDYPRWLWPAIYLPMAIPVSVWVGAVMGGVLTAVRRGIAGEDPWSRPAIAWGALRHLGALFWLALFVGLGLNLALLARQLGEHGQPVHLVLRLGYWWAMAALLLAPAIIVSEGVSAHEGARRALGAWRRAPLQLGMVIVLGVAAVWAARLVSWLIVEAVGGTVAAGVVLMVLRYAVRAVVMTWAAAVALLLWQRVRGRVMADNSLGMTGNP